MKNKLKVISFLLAVLFIFPLCLTACGKDGGGDGGKGGAGSTLTIETVMSAATSKIDSTSKTLFATDYRPASGSGATMRYVSIYEYLGYQNQCNSIAYLLDYIAKNQTEGNGYVKLDYNKVYTYGDIYAYKFESKQNGLKTYFDMIDSDDETNNYLSYIDIDYVDGAITQLSFSGYSLETSYQAVLDFVGNKFYLLFIDNTTTSVAGNMPTADKFNSGKLTIQELAIDNHYMLVTGNITDNKDAMNYTGYDFTNDRSNYYIDTFNIIYGKNYAKCPMRKEKLVGTSSVAASLFNNAFDYSTNHGINQTIYNEKDYYSFVFVGYEDITNILTVTQQYFDAYDGTSKGASAMSKALLTALRGYVATFNAKNFTGIANASSESFVTNIDLVVKSETVKYNRLTIYQPTGESNAKYIKIGFDLEDYTVKTIEEFDGSTVKTIYQA